MTAADLEHARNRIAEELPRHVRWLLHGTPLDFDFSRSRSRLQPLSASEIHGAMEPDWATLYPFGMQDYAEGGGASPFLGVDGISGEVRGLDVERDSSCLFLLNSNVEAFIETFTLFDRALRLGTASVNSLPSAAAEIDQQVFERSDWAKLLGFLLGG